MGRSHYLIRLPIDLGPFSVLIADDDDGCRDSVAEALEREGHRVITVSGGSAAVDVARSTFVHLSILDMNMPDLNGLDTFRILRRMDRALPVLFMTAETEQDLVRKALSEGAYWLLRKPISTDALRHAVREALLRFYVPGRRPRRPRRGGPMSDRTGFPN